MINYGHQQSITFELRIERSFVDKTGLKKKYLNSDNNNDLQYKFKFFFT